MVKNKRLLSSILSIIMLCLALNVTPAKAQDTSIRTSRLSGNDRYETSVAISKSGWMKADTVIITTGLDFPDALSASSLAKAKDSPILLTEKNIMKSVTIDEIKRLKATKAILVGGTNVIGIGVENQLKGLGISTTRIGGSDRYDTSKKVAETIGLDNGIIIATGLNFPDALSIAPIAGIKAMPILLSPKTHLDSGIEKLIENKDIPVSYIVGERNVLDNAIEKSVPNSKRLGGENRYSTNLNINKEFASDLNFDTIYLATGNSFPDALSGSALAAKNNAPIFLTDKNSIFSDIINFLKESKVKNVVIIGGYNVVSKNVENIVSGKNKDPLATLNNKADEIIKSIIKPGMSDIQKEFAIHDYLVLNTKYDYDNYIKGTVPYESYTPYGVLVNGVGVCQGYAEAAKLLFDKSGIESYIVFGEASSGGSSGGHAWNIVKIGGKYYQLDVTWDDPVTDDTGFLRYDYFNLSDKEISKDHTPNAGQALPKCNDNRYDYLREYNIYYKNIIRRDDKYFYLIDKNGDLIKISYDGLEKKVLENSIYPGNIIKWDDKYFYFISKNYDLIKISYDGLEKEVLCDQICYYEISGDYIIYYNSKEDTLYKIKYDGTGKTRAAIAYEESLVLNKTAVDLTIGYPLELKVTIDGINYPIPYGELIFSSSDTGIAGVNEYGEIMPIREGSATITVKVKDTDISRKCAVTVKKPKFYEKINPAYINSDKELYDLMYKAIKEHKRNLYIDITNLDSKENINWLVNETESKIIDENKDLDIVRQMDVSSDFLNIYTINIDYYYFIDNSYSYGDTNIIASIDKKTLFVGDNAKITVENISKYSSNEIKYSVEDESIASIDENGNVKALSNGETFIDLDITQVIDNEGHEGFYNYSIQIPIYVYRKDAEIIDTLDYLETVVKNGEGKDSVEIIINKPFTSEEIVDTVVNSIPIEYDFYANINEGLNKVQYHYFN